MIDAVKYPLLEGWDWSSWYSEVMWRLKLDINDSGVVRMWSKKCVNFVSYFEEVSILWVELCKDWMVARICVISWCGATMVCDIGARGWGGTSMLGGGYRRMLSICRRQRIANIYLTGCKCNAANKRIKTQMALLEKCILNFLFFFPSATPLKKSKKNSVIF